MIDLIRANADGLLAVASVVYAVMFLPQLIHQAKVRACTVPLMTSLPYLGATCLMGVVFATLAMWLTAGIDVLMMGLWLVVIWQRVTYGDGSST